MKDNHMKDMYSLCHLVIAAIRVLEHQQNAPPTIDEVCKILSASSEQINFICRKLNEIGAIDIFEGGYGIRLDIKDHLKVEAIPKNQDVSSIQKDIQHFLNSKQDIDQKIETIKSQKEKKKKQLFAEIESKLKMSKSYDREGTSHKNLNKT